MKTLLLVGAVICSSLFLTNPGLSQNTNFVLACSPTVATNPTCLAVADVNGDGKPDIICASTISSSANRGALTVLTNDGTGVFGSNATLLVNGSVPCVIATDVNGDGKPDLIGLLYNTSAAANLIIFTNNGSGTFGSNAIVNVGSIYGAGLPTAQSLAGTDINGDGKPDLVVAGNSGSYYLNIYTNNGFGKFGLNGTLNILPYPQSVVVGDFNGDGKPDIIAGGSLNLDPGYLEEFLNNGSGILVSNTTVNTGENPTCLATADINGDGKTDVVCYDIGTHTLTVFTNFFNGTFTVCSNAVPAAITNLSWIAAVDVNQDKKVDLITADPVANSMTVFTNNGNGYFGLNATLNVGRKPVYVAATDVNGDGKPDLICINQLDNTLTVLTNAIAIPVPTLNIVTIGSQSALIWQATPWNYVLQTSTNLSSGNWTTVSNGMQNICITVTNSAPNAFYRLQMQ
jgi:hypothetical protein